MMQDGQFDRAPAFDRGQADAFATTPRFKRTPVHLQAWWKAFLEGVACKALSGMFVSDELEWRYLSSPTALIGKKVRPISEDEFYARFESGLPVGSMEWAHVATKRPGAEVILFLLSGPDAEEEIRVFANDVSAASEVHRVAMRERIAQHPLSRQPLAPFTVLPAHAPVHIPTRMRVIGSEGMRRPVSVRPSMRPEMRVAASHGSASMDFG